MRVQTGQSPRIRNDSLSSSRHKGDTRTSVQCFTKFGRPLPVVKPRQVFANVGGFPRISHFPFFRLLR